jgi:hypothetical protein
MKTKVTYSEVKAALELGFVSPLNSAETYVVVEFAGHTDIELPAQVKKPAFYVGNVAGLYDWFNVSDSAPENMVIGQKYKGRLVNGYFFPIAA